MLPPNVIPLLPREQKAVTPWKEKGIGRRRSLGSKSVENEVDWLKSLLPVPESGWWDVRREDQGFLTKFRWRSAGEQPNQTFPRISREQFRKLQEMNADERIAELGERITGHLEDLLYDPRRRERARLVAARIGVGLEDDRNVAAADSRS